MEQEALVSYGAGSMTFTSVDLKRYGIPHVWQQPAVGYAAPAPVVKNTSVAPAASYVASASAVYAAPAPLIDYVAPAPAVSYTAPALAVYAELLPMVNCVSTASQQSVTQNQLPSTLFP